MLFFYKKTDFQTNLVHESGFFLCAITKVQKKTRIQTNLNQTLLVNFNVRGKMIFLYST
jgi:hypothetical protein